MHSKKTVLAAAFAAVAALTLSACGGGGDSADNSVAEVSSGTGSAPATVLDQPFTKPDLVLTDTHGEKYDLREQTKESRPSSTSATPTAPTSAR